MATLLRDFAPGGTLSGVGMSPLFTPWQNATFTVNLTFPSSATGVVTLTRSTEGGLSFAPIKAGARAISAAARPVS